MSGIAEILLNQGFKVSGSDKSKGKVTERLEKLGAKIYLGHAAENIAEGVSLVVFSSAIPAENPELIIARDRNIPVLRRAEVLAEIMRLKYSVGVAGSHGKTSTTSMTGAILEQGDLDPTVIVGGIVHSFGSSSKLGKSNYLVAETDESDRSFLLLKPTIAVVTNIDAEHMSAYKSFEELQEAFLEFVSSVPFYGLAVLCSDDPQVRKLMKKVRGRYVTYGLSPDADIRAEFLEISPKGTKYKVFAKDQELGVIQISLIGKHFMLNSLAAIAVGLEFGISFADIQKALNKFAGVARRVEVLGQANKITVINDYAHHPTEIKASLSAIREGLKKDDNSIYLLFQPHRYSRVKECFQDFQTCFVDSDHLLLSDIYSAGEAQIEGISSGELAKKITHDSCKYVAKLEDCLEVIKDKARPGDVVVCMGAGSVGSFANNVLSELGK